MNLNLVTKEEFDVLNSKIDTLIAYLKVNVINENDELLNSKEAQNYLKVSSKTLQNYRDSGILSFSQMGRKIFYTKQELNDFLKQIKIK